MINDDLRKAWKLYREGRFFKTTLEPLIGYYGWISHPTMVYHWERIFEEEGQRPYFRREDRIVNSFNKDFFKQLKDCEEDGRKPPLLMTFNCIHSPSSVFKLKRDLGDTRKKFIRFNNNGIEYLSSNIFTSVELLGFMSTDHGLRLYQHQNATPIPTFEVFLKVITFSKRFLSI